MYRRTFLRRCSDILDKDNKRNVYLIFPVVFLWMQTHEHRLEEEEMRKNRTECLSKEWLLHSGLLPLPSKLAVEKKRKESTRRRRREEEEEERREYEGEEDHWWKSVTTPANTKKEKRRRKEETLLLLGKETNKNRKRSWRRTGT